MSHSILEKNKAGILYNTPEKNWDDWQWQLNHRITDVDELNLPWLTHDERCNIKKICESFPMAITPYYLSLMDLSDPDDPLMKQAVPSEMEMFCSGLSYVDPLKEDASSPVKGITHRYPDRVLFIITSTCAVYCRHCTRKRKWKYIDRSTLSASQMERCFTYISKHGQIRDVLVSGGDPLLLSNRFLENVLKRLRSIGHVEIIRIGTRVPVVLPQRIDRTLLEVLEKYGPIWLNTQFNHMNEITDESARACDLLLRHGIPVNNQTVLLKGINDHPQVIKKLNQGLLKIKVRPYYLLQCDPVTGTEHFRTSVQKGVQIIENLRGHTSGLAVPHFVVDLPGGGGKVSLIPEYMVSHKNDCIIFRNYEGKLFAHHDPQCPHQDL